MAGECGECTLRAAHTCSAHTEVRMSNFYLGIFTCVGLCDVFSLNGWLMVHVHDTDIDCRLAHTSLAFARVGMVGMSSKRPTTWSAFRSWAWNSKSGPLTA